MGEKKRRKLLERAKTAPGSWDRDDLIELYKEFGFFIEARTKHDLAKHVKLPDGVKATITRSSGDLHPDYVRTAVELIEIVLKSTEAQNG